jgi:hypothetical protein
MHNGSADPIIVFLMFVARCIVPLFLMLGVSYLLKRLGLIQEPPSAPEPEEVDDTEKSSTDQTEGDLVHGKA